MTAEYAVRHLPGQGVLARFGEMMMLCDAVPGQESRIRNLINAVAEVAESPDGGRVLSRRLAGVLSTTSLDNDFPALAVVGPAGTDGVAALVHGNARLTLTTDDGSELRLDGRDSVTLTDRVISAPIQAIRAFLGDTPAAEVDRGWGRIKGGVVRADALVYQPAEPPTGSQVLGVYCKNTHFNDPAIAYCGTCGISMAQLSRPPVWGERPQLGVLVFDDGRTYPLVRDHVVGRTPDMDDSVAAGEASPVALPDPRVSRLHARVVLKDWQVSLVDTDSANGTYVQDGDSAWTRVTPGTVTPLRPGTAGAFGSREFRYYSYRAA
ncbi:MAG: FHA domain-containing protein [Kibdelosporangium sp.]